MIYIFTLNWNKADNLLKLKDSLLPNLQDIEYKWLIKDNASKDNSVELIASWQNENSNIILNAYPNNLQNFSQGMNYLFDQITPDDDDFILLLNNDVVFNDKYSLKNMMNIMRNDSNVGIVGARLLYTGTNKLQHAGVVFKPGVNLPTHFRAGEKSDANAEKNREFQAVTGAVMLTKAKYYKINKLDNYLVWAFDDISFCMDVKFDQKKKIIYCGQTNIFHEESSSLKKNPVNKLFMNHNIKYFKDKWKSRYIADEDIYLKNQKHNLY